jgi:hypothetical protein
MKGKYLISTTQYFLAPDGQQYRSVWGEVEILSDTFLGVKTNHNSSNWYLKIGDAENFVLVAGCQVHYAVKCDEKPNTKPVKEWTTDKQSNGTYSYTRPTAIYIAEK